MRYFTILILLINYGQCLSQTKYSETLSLRLDQIRRSEFYDNKVVVKIDSIEYNDLDYPYWKPAETYYRDDMARYKYRLYRVLTDSTRGHRPDTCVTDWALSRRPHPYLYLRDTVTLSELRELMLDPHPYVRSYAFGALSFRKTENLFPLIVDNLKDSTQILEYSGDAGLNAYPADLMIEYEIDHLSEREKKELKKLIRSKYKYLTRGLAVLNRK